MFEGAFMGRFFTHELREEKVREFPTLNKESMTEHGTTSRSPNFPALL